MKEYKSKTCIICYLKFTTITFAEFSIPDK